MAHTLNLKILSVLAALVLACFASVAVAQQGSLTAPGAVSAPDLANVFVDDGKVYGRKVVTDAAVNLTAGATTVCRAGEGAEYTYADWGGHDYVMTYTDGKIHIGGKSVEWACSPDLTGLSADQREVVRLWSLLREAHGGGHHFVVTDLPQVLEAMEKPEGIIAQQTLKRIVGVDHKYLVAGGLMPAHNQMTGWHIKLKTLDYVVWRAPRVGCGDICFEGQLVIHHLHSAPVRKKAVARVTPRQPAPTRTPVRVQTQNSNMFGDLPTIRCSNC